MNPPTKKNNKEISHLSSIIQDTKNIYVRDISPFRGKNITLPNIKKEDKEDKKPNIKKEENKTDLDNH